MWPLNITLFEIYPAYTGNNPAWDDTKVTLDVNSGSAVQDLVVLDSTVEITDIVSGHTSPMTYTYNAAPYPEPSMATPSAPSDLNYTIIAAIPLPSPHYALPLTILATRYSPEGAAQVSFKGFIPILGTIPSEVPNFYPVTTDPTLIFLILRDPPGGSSQAKIEAGSTFTTGIAIEGMKTFDQEVHYETEDAVTADPQQLLITAPFGFGTAESMGNEDAQIGVKGSFVAPDVLVTRTSETHYSYAFKFNYDFSTSDDANTAGHPSDVIVGGGIDVIVSEAIEGIH